MQAPKLPSLEDRLPDLAVAIRACARELSEARPTTSYIPFFEDLYAVVHGLKGVLGILAGSQEHRNFILRFVEVLQESLSGPMVLRKMKDAAKILEEIADRLDYPDLRSQDRASLAEKLDALAACYERDIPHEERMKEVPEHLFYVNEFVSKKAREISLLHLNQCVVEDNILLDQIPFWRTQLQEALLFPEFGRGIVVNFLPFINSEGSRTLKVWAWVAASSHSRATLKQRIKDVMPKVNITKV